MIRRRQLLVASSAGAIAWALRRRALAQGRPVRVGLLALVPPTPVMLRAFRDGLRERGYIEGQNLSIDVRWPQGPFEQNPGVTDDLVRGNVDVIVAWSTPATMAARRATSTLPIVMVSVSDPVGAGFVASLARPGGNITGVTNTADDLSAKLVELLREIVPGMQRVGVVFNPSNPGSAVQMRGTEDAIRALGLQFLVVSARAPKEFESAFAQFSAEGVKGVVLLSDSSFIEHARRIAELAQNTRLPTAFQRRENVEVGGLLSYGSNLNDQFRQAATYVDKILKGAKPADLPVEQPTKFELVINLKTAKELGLTIPPTLLFQANEVIK
jgi:putative ABC transport system substrate-binding protein